MSSVQKFSLGSTNTVAVLATVLTAAAAAVGVMMWSKAQTMPSLPMKEGFGGVAVGSGMPECLRTSSEGAAIAGFFTGRTVTAEEGEDDLRELLLLLSKLACG